MPGSKEFDNLFKPLQTLMEEAIVSIISDEQTIGLMLGTPKSYPQTYFTKIVALYLVFKRNYPDILSIPVVSVVDETQNTGGQAPHYPVASYLLALYEDCFQAANVPDSMIELFCGEEGEYNQAHDNLKRILNDTDLTPIKKLERLTNSSSPANVDNIDAKKLATFTIQQLVKQSFSREYQKKLTNYVKGQNELPERLKAELIEFITKRTPIEALKQAGNIQKILEKGRAQPVTPPAASAAMANPPPAANPNPSQPKAQTALDEHEAESHENNFRFVKKPFFTPLGELIVEAIKDLLSSALKGNYGDYHKLFCHSGESVYFPHIAAVYILLKNYYPDILNFPIVRIVAKTQTTGFLYFPTAHYLKSLYSEGLTSWRPPQDLLNHILADINSGNITEKLDQLAEAVLAPTANPGQALTQEKILEILSKMQALQVYAEKIARMTITKHWGSTFNHDDRETLIKHLNNIEMAAALLRETKDQIVPCESQIKMIGPSKPLEKQVLQLREQLKEIDKNICEHQANDQASKGRPTSSQTSNNQHPQVAAKKTEQALLDKTLRETLSRLSQRAALEEELKTSRTKLSDCEASLKSAEKNALTFIQEQRSAYPPEDFVNELLNKIQKAGFAGKYDLALAKDNTHTRNVVVAVTKNFLPPSKEMFTFFARNQSDEPRVLQVSISRAGFSSIYYEVTYHFLSLESEKLVDKNQITLTCSNNISSKLKAGETIPAGLLQALIVAHLPEIIEHFQPEWKNEKLTDTRLMCAALEKTSKELTEYMKNEDNTFHWRLEVIKSLGDKNSGPIPSSPSNVRCRCPLYPNKKNENKTTLSDRTPAAAAAPTVAQATAPIAAATQPSLSAHSAMFSPTTSNDGKQTNPEDLLKLFHCKDTGRLMEDPVIFILDKSIKDRVPAELKEMNGQTFDRKAIERQLSNTRMLPEVRNGYQLIPNSWAKEMIDFIRNNRGATVVFQP